MVEVTNVTRMAISTKVNSYRVKLMVWVNTDGPMVSSTMVSGNEVCEMAKAYGKVMAIVRISMLGIGAKIRLRDMEPILGQMVILSSLITSIGDRYDGEWQ